MENELKSDWNEEPRRYMTPNHWGDTDKDTIDITKIPLRKSEMYKDNMYIIQNKRGDEKTRIGKFITFHTNRDSIEEVMFTFENFNTSRNSNSQEISMLNPNTYNFFIPEDNGKGIGGKRTNGKKIKKRKTKNRKTKNRNTKNRKTKNRKTKNIRI